MMEFADFISLALTVFLFVWTIAWVIGFFIVMHKWKKALKQFKEDMKDES